MQTHVDEATAAIAQALAARGFPVADRVDRLGLLDVPGLCSLRVLEAGGAVHVGVVAQGDEPGVWVLTVSTDSAPALAGLAGEAYRRVRDPAPGPVDGRGIVRLAGAALAPGEELRAVLLENATGAEGAFALWRVLVLESRPEEWTRDVAPVRGDLAQELCNLVRLGAANLGASPKPGSAGPHENRQ